MQEEILRPSDLTESERMVMDGEELVYIGAGELQEAYQHLSTSSGKLH
jgi:hypothetical protein